MSAFEWPVRVYFEDTDAGGIVYHASYLRFAERARTEWLRALGFGQRGLAERFGCIFAVRRCGLDCRRPARLDDALVVVTRPRSIGGARLALSQEVRRGAELLQFCQTALKQASQQVQLLEAGVLKDFTLDGEPAVADGAQ